MSGSPEIAARILEWWCEGWEAEAEWLDEEIREAATVVVEAHYITVVRVADWTGEQDNFGVKLPDGSKHLVSFTKGMVSIPMEKPILKLVVLDQDVTIEKAVEILAEQYAVGEYKLARRRG